MVLDFHKFSSMVQLVRTHLKGSRIKLVRFKQGYSKELKVRFFFFFSLTYFVTHELVEHFVVFLV